MRMSIYNKISIVFILLALFSIYNNNNHEYELIILSTLSNVMHYLSKIYDKLNNG